MAMIEIAKVRVSEELIESHFVCDLERCGSACCKEGIYGAPLQSGEVDAIARDLEAIREGLDPQANELIGEQGWHRAYTRPPSDGQSLHPDGVRFEGTMTRADGSCAFFVHDGMGGGTCGIEKAFRAGKTQFLKPRSCHLYPIAVRRLDDEDVEHWSYHRRPSCDPACRLGAKAKVPLYRFLEDAIVRDQGEEFFGQLEQAAEDHCGK